MSKRLVLVGACLLAEACQGSQSMSLRVFTPDGGDPWVGDDAATQARLRIEDHQTPDQTVTVASDGSFSLQVVLANPDATVRVVVEALRGGQVVGWGGTPLAQWGSFGPVLLPVYVQRRDTLAGAPWSPGAARTSPMLFELAAPYVTALGGAVQAAAPDVFDDLAMRRVDGAAVLDDTFNRDASAIKLTDGTILLVRGCAALIWSPGATPSPCPPTACRRATAATSSAARWCRSRTAAASSSAVAPGPWRARASTTFSATEPGPPRSPSPFRGTIRRRCGWVRTTPSWPAVRARRRTFSSATASR